MGIVVLAAASGVVAMVYLLLAALAYVGAMPLARGAFLLGPGLETYGPAMFVIFAVLYARLAFDLWRVKRWGRYLGLILSGLGIYVLVPSISSAVVDVRLAAIARDGVQIMLRVLMIWYLLQPPVKEAFDA